MTTTCPPRSALVARPGDAVEPASLGAEAGGLWRLAADGLPVPRLAVVTTEAYRTVVDGGGLGATLRRLPPPVGDDERQRRLVDGLFLAVPVAEELVDEIVLAATAVSAADGAVVVRSSATDPRAGPHRFFPELRSPDAIVRAVRLTWASLWHPAARRHRGQGGDVGEAAMAVLVTELLRPCVAGVASTIEPAGDEGLVRVDVVPGSAGRPGGWGWAPEVHLVPRGDPSFADSALAAAVAAMALRAERTFGCPQEVEWAWDGALVRIVQCRPASARGRAEGGRPSP